MPMMTTTTASPTDPATPTCPPRWRRAHVSWFDTAKGFGFLTPASGGPAVFVDYTTIDVPGYKTLAPGQPVAYLATDTDRGPEATRVIPDPRSNAGRHHASADTARRRRSRWTARRLPVRDVFGQ